MRGNVRMIEPIPNMGLMEPDRARDQAIRKDAHEALSKENTDAQVRDFDKYRTFVSDEYWTDISFDR